MKISKTGMRACRAASLGSLVVCVAALVGGCKSTPAPAEKAPAPTSTIRLDPTDPVPRDEPLNATANKWYGANGRLYRPITDDREFKERGKASVIAIDMEGKETASGELYAASGMTAAHSILPIPSYARVTDLRTGKSAVVRVNDRGAYDRDETIAISPAVAQKIGLAGNDEVQVERITSAQIAALPSSQPAAPPPPVAVAAPQPPAPPPPEPKPLPPQQPAVAPAPEMARPPAAAAAAAPPKPVTAPAPATARPPASTAAPKATAPVAAAAVAPAAAPTPAPRAATTPPPTSTRTTQSATTGRWSVQIASFATSSLAESTRTRVAQQLAQDAPNLPEADRTPRVERRGNRSYVLVGDFADRDSAEALAGRLRAALRQDVVVERN